MAQLGSALALGARGREFKSLHSDMVSTINEYHNRMAKMRLYLGGKCVKCNTTENLQFDHINPNTKSFDVAKNWARRWEVLVIELDKCQLLCKPHHLEKSIENKELNQVDHGGGLSGKKNCSCLLCKAKKAQYMKTYMESYIRMRDL